MTKFNPRRQIWQRHFGWKGITLVGKTKIGRTTIVVFGMNMPDRIALRETLLNLGQWPDPTPTDT
jgi:hypothetical protein